MSALIRTQASNTLKSYYPYSIIFLGSIFLIIASNIGLDFYVTLNQKSSFFISEALLFSSYWLLYIPIISLLYYFQKIIDLGKFKIPITIFAILLQLLLYPVLVWFLSKTLYYHTFEYWQTFDFSLSAYCIKTILIYSFLCPILFPQNVVIQPSKTTNHFIDLQKLHCIHSILITEKNNIKFKLAVADIIYFAANSPYVDIFVNTKKHIHTETLKSLESQLNDNQFIRIHKSYIINLQKVTAYQSRHNGDYDVTLSNDAILRISRNYAKCFKAKFIEFNRLTTN